MALLTGSDMSVINSDPKKKNYSDHSSYSYSGIGPKERALNYNGAFPAATSVGLFGKICREAKSFVFDSAIFLEYLMMNTAPSWNASSLTNTTAQVHNKVTSTAWP